MYFHCRTGSGFLSILKFLQMNKVHFPCMKNTKNTKRQSSCPSSFPWSCLLFLGRAFAKWSISRNSGGKYRRMGAGWSQRLSVLPVQTARSHKIWCQNSPYQNLCFQKKTWKRAGRVDRHIQTINVGMTTEQSFTGIACFGSGVRRVSCLSETKTPPGIIRKAESKFQFWIF